MKWQMIKLKWTGQRFLNIPSMVLMSLMLSSYFNISQAAKVEELLEKISQPQSKSKPLGECPLVSFDKKVSPDIGGRKETFNTTCFVEVDAIDPSNYQIIDVRNQTDYQISHIKGAINIPLQQIANKHFLKKKNILLVNNGLPQFEMGQFCQILKDKGFKKVSVLKGGIHNWLSHGLTLKTMGYQNKNVDVVKLEDFMMDYDNKLVQVVNIKPKKGDIYRIVQDAKLLSLHNKNRSIKEQLTTIWSNRTDSSKQIVVMLSEHDYLYAKMQLNGAILKDIYYLFGDKDKLHAFKRKQIAINQTRVAGPTVKQCGS